MVTLYTPDTLVDVHTFPPRQVDNILMNERYK